MKRLFMVGAAALVLVSLLPDVACAQRGMRGGGGAAGIGGGGSRGVAVGVGSVRPTSAYRGAVGIGSGYGIRSAAGGRRLRHSRWRLRRIGRCWAPRIASCRLARGRGGASVAAGIVRPGLRCYGYPSYGYSSYESCHGMAISG
jgi:hypothetical protein